ncbi:MAG: serine/threonine protein kinase [Deltaproteobacteria bacterium]|nr:serine/threonine protein kinase [Deltaproteobacteria bacterium]
MVDAADSQAATHHASDDAESERDARIAALVREGRAREAAAIARDAGRLLQAAELLASVWEWDEASALAVAAGNLPLAYRYALETGAPEKRVALLRALYDRPDDALVAADHAERRSRADEAAGLRMAAGDVDGAARLYELAGDLARAAACHASAGRYRDAGKLYERRVREAPEDMESHLALARVLARFGRDEPAARSFQAAARAALAADLPSSLDGPRATVFAEAQRGLIACLERMGFREAATAALDELRQREHDLPLTIDEMRAKGELPVVGEAESTYLAGRYRIVRPLGSGATGRVYLARDAFYERDVAVKVLHITNEGAGRDAYARFVKESRIAAAIDHPHVVRVLEFNPDGPFLVVELMEGGTLEDRFAATASGALPLGDVRPIARAVLDGLEAVHRRGIVHRDLKPANVLFTAAGQVKIGDFGVAHLADFGATMTGAMLGTLAYMAPEQITGGKPDASTDLYAFGVILVRMLTGRLPFPGPDYLAQHVHDAPPRPSSLRPALGVAYDDLVLRLLAKEQKDRPRGAAELRDALDALTFVEPDDDVMAATPVARGAPSVRPSAPPSRYVIGAMRPDGSRSAHDTLVDRPVVLVPIDERLAARYRRLALADGPFLQAVLGIDETTGEAVLEDPRGRSLLECGPMDRQRALRDVGAAVAVVRAAAARHGAIDAEHVRVAAGRAVLLLPTVEPAAETDDVDALERLRVVLSPP